MRIKTFSRFSLAAFVATAYVGIARAEVPDNLDRGAISKGVASVRTQLQSCGEKSAAKGKVKVRVTVAPEGSVSKVVVVETPAEALGTCVAEAIRAATFQATKHGGAFSYPFVF